MFQKRKFLITLGSLAFSFGMLTIGYSFWTDSLDIEGKADVRLSVNVVDDVAEEITTSPEAVALPPDPAVRPPETSGGSSSSGTGNAPENSNPPETKPAEPEQNNAQDPSTPQEEKAEAPADNAAPAGSTEQTKDQKQENPEPKPDDSNNQNPGGTDPVNADNP